MGSRRGGQDPQIVSRRSDRPEWVRQIDVCAESFSGDGGAVVGCVPGDGKRTRGLAAVEEALNNASRECASPGHPKAAEPQRARSTPSSRRQTTDTRKAEPGRETRGGDPNVEIRNSKQSQSTNDQRFRTPDPPSDVWRIRSLELRTCFGFGASDFGSVSLCANQCLLFRIPVADPAGTAGQFGALTAPRMR